MQVSGYILANFGGPRSSEEIRSFLTALLCDQEVLRTPLPRWVHRALFSFIAARRAVKITEDYHAIGGHSPIFEDTIQIARKLSVVLGRPVIPFHRYLPATHSLFFKEVGQLPCGEIRVFPLFPQFSYATTGSIATFFRRHLDRHTCLRLRWIKSYPRQCAYIRVIQGMIRDYLQTHQIEEREVILVFSAHGLPVSFIQQGDVYHTECQSSMDAVLAAFPLAMGLLSFQSKFGRGEWMRPYTIDCVNTIASQAKGRTKVIIVPISFTSDHIETLFEIEQQYLPPIRSQGLEAHRLPAMNQRPDWIDAITQILVQETLVSNQMLIR